MSRNDDNDPGVNDPAVDYQPADINVRNNSNLAYGILCGVFSETGRLLH